MNLYKLPEHIAIIMDGNGRWAQKRGLPRFYGHREGAKAVERVIDYSLEFNIKYLTLFAFSTENWGRPKEEVDTIMSLLVEYINKKVPYLIERDVKLRFMGRRKDLPEMILKSVEEGEEKTKNGKKMELIIALNYSGRAEIVDAVNAILQDGKEVNEENFKGYLYLPDVPDPDLLIRTSGEIRISNFMLWQLAYTELHFTEVLWPDFSKDDFIKALYDYQSRERRFGKVSVSE